MYHVPDQIFSNKIIGDGVAIIPDEGILYSPISGVIRHISKTGNTISIKNNDFEVLIHIGINSVNISKDIFKVMVSVEEEINIGKKLILFNLDKLKEEAKSIITPIIFRNLKIGEYIYFEENLSVRAKSINILQIHSSLLNIKEEN